MIGPIELRSYKFTIIHIEHLHLHLQSMAFPNKAQQNDIRQSLPPLTGIYPTMNMMLTGKNNHTVVCVANQ